MLRYARLYIYDNYGAAGSDKAWVTGTAEIFEYQYARLNSTIGKKVENGVLIVTVDLATLPEFYINELSLMVKGVKPQAMSFSENVTKASWADATDYTLINFGTAQRALKLAEKYTAAAETLKIDESKAEARIIISTLEPNLKAKYTARLDAISSAPAIEAEKTYTLAASKGAIIVNGELAAPVSIYRIDGTLFATIPAASYTNHSISASAAIYLAATQKLLVY